MNPEPMREELLKLYEWVWSRLMDTMPNDAGISLPLFISPPDDYFEAKHRLMIVGRETGEEWPMLQCLCENPKLAAYNGL